MLNKLYIDLGKCAILSGHGNQVGHRELDTILITDRDGHQRQIVLDKVVDHNEIEAANAISRVYDSFYTKTNKEYWAQRIEAFEFVNQIDWYLLLSYIYMVDEDDRDGRGRELRTATNACAVLCAIDVENILNSAEYKSYLAMSAKNDKIMEIMNAGINKTNNVNME